jgi:xanthine dehydrogenase molybdenum-binding subunit
MPTLSFRLNGHDRHVPYEEGMHLLDILREECGVVSPKDGCAPQGTCGCCTVLLDGTPVLSCLKKPEHVEGREVTTLEGISHEERRILAEAFVHEGAIQCGFCIPGIVLRAKSLLDRGVTDDRDAVAKALSGHLCRCTGYTRILDAIQTAGEMRRSGGRLPRRDPRHGDVFGAARGIGRRDEDRPRGPNGVGASAPRYRGLDHALGEKPYIADMKLDGMLHGAVVLSDHPRAIVKRIHTTEAGRRAGVVRVVTARDVPGDVHVGLVVSDWPIFVGENEEVRCVGDVLALVVADTQFHARRAAAAVVADYEPLPPVVDAEEALKPDAPKVQPSGNLLESCAFGRGDVDRALAESAHVVTQRFETQRVEHAYLEPEACLAVRDGDGVLVYTQGQGVHEDQKQIARVLGVPPEKVRVELISNGGAFGGKEDLSIQAQTALAAWLVGRPVRTVLTREESIRLHPKRHPIRMDYTAGCDADGRLLAVRARLIGDSGAYASVGGKVLERAAGHACGPYRVPNVDIESKAVYTNNPPSGAMRGFGVNQVAFAIEGVLDLLAERVGIDGYAIRERNVLEPGDRFATGQIMGKAVRGLRRSLEAVRGVYQHAKFAGIACGIKNTGIGNGLDDTGRTAITVAPRGRVEIRTGYTEMGQGLFTVLRQVVAEETGLDPEVMEVRSVSEMSIECGMTTASRATALGSEAARIAARKLAADLAMSRLEGLAGRTYHGEYDCSFTVKPGTGAENPITHVTFSYATQVVILDDAGRIERVVAAHDVGRAINPILCAGQIEGSVHMGLGYALSEDLPCSGGRPESLLLRDLGIVKAKDTPEIEVILIEEHDEVGGYGAKGVGEIGLVPTAPAVAAALRAFDGKWRFKLPMSDAIAARPSVPRGRRPDVSRPPSRSDGA